MSFYFVTIDLVLTKKTDKLKDVLTNTELLQEAWILILRLVKKNPSILLSFLKKSSFKDVL